MNVVLQAMQVAMMIGLPVLLVALVLGLAISIFQAVTQIQEQTLAFIPKIIGVGVVLLVAGPWMMNQVLSWTEQLYTAIPSLVGG